jgi:four helix bundle protein
VTTITAQILLRLYFGDRTFVPDNYRNLIAWQKAKTLALNVYPCTRRFPKDEIYGLSPQMRRAAVSVPSNIAEGKGRYSQKEFVQFLYHARGSLLELETQLSIARDLNYVDLPVFESLESETEELGRILNGLINRFQVSSQRVS